MFSKSSIHDKKVPSMVLPLYTRVMKEVVVLTDYLNSLNTHVPDFGSATAVSDSENADLLKMLSQLETPRSFFALQRSEKLSVDSAEKSIPNITRYIAEQLYTIYARIIVTNLHVKQSNDTYLFVYKNINFYRMALTTCTHTLENDRKTRRVFAGKKNVKRRLQTLRLKIDHLVSMPIEVIRQYDEEAYLLANEDVGAAVRDGVFDSGLEHFVIKGAQEAKQGGRRTPGVDLELIACEQASDTADQLEHVVSVLEASGMFDAEWYKKQYGVKESTLLDYCKAGYLQGRNPNSLFDGDWYCRHYPDINPEVLNPAFHYVHAGEAEGRMPCERFDPSWYKSYYEIKQGLALVHYLRKGALDGLNPNPLFDRAHYLETYGDVQDAGMDPLEHYYIQGWREGKNPCPWFDYERYVSDNLGNEPSSNPLTHALVNKANLEEYKNSLEPAEPGIVYQTKLPSLDGLAGNIKYFSNPGPDFERPSLTDCRQLRPKAKTVAFYLPQFHAFAENDRWWGKGFTEWRNVARGAPRFAGHYQPRIPRDLGFYDLNDINVLHEQSALAIQNGIEAFCFYYYWFNGKRLMKKPLDMFADNEFDQEFCIMWANENWTRTWDGFDSEVLIEQNYHDEDEDGFIADIARYFKNPRYMKINGKPLFIMYRPGLMPNARQTFKRWRSKWKKILGIEPWILMVQGFGNEDPREFGLDGAVEFPPHKICKDLPNVQDQLRILDPEYEGYVRSYTDTIKSSLQEVAPDFPLIKTVVPHWDNDARREGRGFTMYGSTPALYESWLNGAVQYAVENPFQDQPLVFINAWNEWAEAAYLEPDVHYGHAYLNATRRAIFGLTNVKDRQKILLVGHDAYKHGAQMLLLSMSKTYQQQFGMEVTILLKQSGPLLSNYQDVCRTVVLENLGEVNLEGWLRQELIDIAICNTSVTGDLVPILSRAGLRVISLIHELPNLIAEYDLGSNLQMIAEYADSVVFPSPIVQEGFRQFASSANAKQVIQPQGSYKSINFDTTKRMQIRDELGMDLDDKLVLNVGYADLRKGFDIFLQIARQMLTKRADVHFVWAGSLSIDMQRWVQSDLDESMSNRIHVIGFTDKIADYYSACDCLFLTSREDPYPTVVLEAMEVGAPVVLFKSATGFDELISRYGFVVDRHDHPRVLRALVQALYNDSSSKKHERQEYVKKHCRFDDYCFRLLQRLRPEIRKISVVVPNYNYAEYMQSRMVSVFSQTYPIFEIIVLDDCSNDNSLQVIGQVAKDASRVIDLSSNERNSGNVFRQWRQGLSACRGELVWIAEADDFAESTFIARSLESFDSDTALSFSDSKQIDISDKVLANSYGYYYRTVDKDLFQTDFRLGGKEFIDRAMSVKNVIMNVSSVLWRHEALARALESVGDELLSYRLVGDWRLYLEVLDEGNINIAYVAESLNTHRRHNTSVTHSLDHETHLAEIQAMHDLLETRFNTDSDRINEMHDYTEQLRVEFGLQDPVKKVA